MSGNETHPMLRHCKNAHVINIPYQAICINKKPHELYIRTAVVMNIVKVLFVIHYS